MGADETPCLTMFESKEEVERTMLALKIFPDIDQVVAAEQEEPETDEEEYAPQVFPEHTAAETRYKKPLLWGFACYRSTKSASHKTSCGPVHQYRARRPRPKAGQARHGQSC